MKARSLLVLALALTVSAVALPARADAEDDARARVKRGLELYDEGDFRLALVELERAYEIAPSYKLLYNIGQIHAQLGEYARAQRALRRYLDEGGADILPERRAEVEKDLTALAGRVATVTIQVNVVDADVFVNDQVVRAPAVKLPVEPGALRIVVTKSGYESQTRIVRLAGGDETVVEVKLVPMRREVVVDDRGMGTPALVGWIVTGALATGAVVTGIAANDAYSTFEERRGAPFSGSVQQAAVDLDKQGDRADALALTTDLLIGSAIVAGGISLWLTLRGKPKPGVPAFVASW